MSDDRVMVTYVGVVAVVVEHALVQSPIALQVTPIPLLARLQREDGHEGGPDRLEMVRPGGDVVEMALLVEVDLVVVGVGASQPVGRSGKCPEVLRNEVKDEISLEDRTLLLEVMESRRRLYGERGWMDMDEWMNG